MTKWLAGALLVIAVVWSVVYGASAGDEREFSLSTDPTTEVLALRWRGGNAGFHVLYQLYSDGRIVMSRTDPTERKIWDKYEVEISYAEVESLMQRAVNSGLIEFDSRSLVNEIGNYSVIDGATAYLTLNLESYRGPNQDNASPKTVEIVLKSPGILSLQNPHVPELRSVAEIAKIFEEFWSAAAKKD